MHITFQERTYPFVPWRPEMGTVLGKQFSFDCETTRIDEDHPWLTPTYVLGAAFDGERGFFVHRKRLGEFFAAHADHGVVFHNAAFDLDVIAIAGIDLYDRVDADLVFDTQLMHRLLTLGVDGHTSHGKGESTLEYCAAHYIGYALPKETLDSTGSTVRLSYGRWLSRSLEEIEVVYLEYLAMDVVATRLLFEELRDRTQRLLENSADVWGFVSRGWLRSCMGRFGLQTHHIQLKASIVLRAITANGLHLDTELRGEIEKSLVELQKVQKAALRAYGFLAGGKGSDKSLQAVLKSRARKQPHLNFPRTETGQFATAHDALQDLADSDPFVKALLEFRETEKLLGSFVGKLSKPVVHPSFNVLVKSGRTSSFGDINAQNLPKSDSVRACFVPSRGHEFIGADYAMIEMVTLAQACLKQFQLPSKMAEAINAKQDLHRLVAAQMLGKSPDEVTKEERQKAKPVNFGKPGGMGTETLIKYAKVNYGIVLSPEEAERLSNSWLDLFPEMNTFLSDDASLSEELAGLLNLTPESHYAFTGDTRFIRHPENVDRKDRPHPLLGGMLLKVTKEPSPQTGSGKPYSAEDLNYFWTKLAAVVDRIPAAQRSFVTNRIPSKMLRRSVMGLVGRSPVYTFTGRTRADATYSARHNTIFQGLAADGAKLALWKLWRAGFRIVNFIHDEVLIEIPTCTPRKRFQQARAIREHMIDGMREVVPDVRVDVAYAATDRWYKDAEALHDPTGEELYLWSPKQHK